MSHTVFANTKNTWRLSIRSVAEQQKIDPQTLAERTGLHWLTFGGCGNKKMLMCGFLS